MQGQFRMHRCTMAGVEAVAAHTRHCFPRHTHEQFGIGLIHAGGHRSYSGRGMVEAGPGDIIAVNPGEIHDGAPIGDASRAWTMLYFDPVLVHGAAADLGEGRSARCELSRPALTHAPAADLFRRLFDAATGVDAAAIGQEALLLSLLAALLGTGSEPRPPCPAAIRRAKALIDDAPSAPASLADLARESGLSRFQVLRGFVRATGFTPHAYLLQRRIDLVRALIAGGTGLADAALAAGFADQSHMTRSFVRRFGLSPGAYAAALA